MTKAEALRLFGAPVRGPVCSLLDGMEEYQKNAQMNEILAVLVHMYYEETLNRKLAVDVVDQIRTDYLLFHGLIPATNESERRWCAQSARQYSQLLYGNVQVDGEFRHRAEDYIRLIIMLLHAAAAVPPAHLSASRAT
jgi:hypothetical protein